MEIKLYVGNLAFSTTEDELRTLFAQAGTVTSVIIIKDRDTGSSKGFGFVEMGSQAEAEKAIKMFNGFSLGNREIKVNPARPKEETGRGGGSGGYGARPGGGGCCPTSSTASRSRSRKSRVDGRGTFGDVAQGFSLGCDRDIDRRVIGTSTGEPPTVFRATEGKPEDGRDARPTPSTGPGAEFSSPVPAERAIIGS